MNTCENCKHFCKMKYNKEAHNAEGDQLVGRCYVLKEVLNLSNFDDLKQYVYVYKSFGCNLYSNKN